jgi:arginase
MDRHEVRQALTLIGAPVEEGAGQPGPIMGPAALRTAGLPATLRALGHEVEDVGDLRLPDLLPEIEEPPHRANNLRHIAAWARLIARETHAVMTRGRLPILLGGDHSLSMGSVSGIARYWQERGRELFVLWFDAHADFNTPETSPSGNMHGMAAALFCGEPGLGAVFGDEPRGLVSPENLHLFGIRSVDRAERELLRFRGVHVVDMRLIDELGASVAIRRIIDQVKARNGVLHVSLDVDFLDPSIAPGVGTAVPGGATYREAHLVMELLHDSGLVGSVDVVELNPFLDVRGRSAKVLVDLVASLFGRQIMGRAG